MSFTNHPLDLDTLPDVQSLDLTPLEPRYRWINLAAILVFHVLVIGGMTAVRFQPFWALPQELMTAYQVAVWALLGLCTLLMVHRFFADPIKAYAVREQDINYRSGLIFRKLVSQPILRIQHVELKRGPLDRMADLATLQVFSAGGIAHTFEIPGLSLDTAKQLRQFVLDHKDLQVHG